MDPERSFKNDIAEHLKRMQKREAAEHRNEVWTVELFREADIASVQATHSRDLLLEFERVSHEVHQIIHEIEGLLPVIIWIWDSARNRADILARVNLIEEAIRSNHRHHERHAQFFERYQQNRERGLAIFTGALQKLRALFDSDEKWRGNPGDALQAIHDAQDGAIMTGVFLEVVAEVTTSLKGIEQDDLRKLTAAKLHLAALAQKLHLKEGRLRKLVVDKRVVAR